jgi:RimJ/RimL family protein N-acetyltransferase
MTLTTQLFRSKNLVLEAYDPEKDAASEAAFTYDFDYMSAIDRHETPHPLTAFEVKKKREEQLKKGSETGNFFLFALLRKEAGTFLGVLSIPRVFWFNRYANYALRIGEPDMRTAYYAEALQMAIRYGLEDLGLYSMVTTTGEYEPEIINSLQAAGFTIAVRQREAVFRDGRLWDLILMELLQEEWKKKSQEEQS